MAETIGFVKILRDRLYEETDVGAVTCPAGMYPVEQSLGGIWFALAGYPSEPAGRINRLGDGLFSLNTADPIVGTKPVAFRSRIWTPAEFREFLETDPAVLDGPAQRMVIYLDSRLAGNAATPTAEDAELARRRLVCALAARAVDGPGIRKLDEAFEMLQRVALDEDESLMADDPLFSLLEMLSEARALLTAETVLPLDAVAESGDAPSDAELVCGEIESLFDELRDACRRLPESEGGKDLEAAIQAVVIAWEMGALPEIRRSIDPLVQGLRAMLAGDSPPVEIPACVLESDYVRRHPEMLDMIAPGPSPEVSK